MKSTILNFQLSAIKLSVFGKYEVGSLFADKGIPSLHLSRLSMISFCLLINLKLLIMRTIVHHTSLVALPNVIYKLEDDSVILIQWYKIKYLKPSLDKWHLFLSDVDNDLNIEVNKKCISNSSCEKILGVNFDNELNFNTHITKLCKKKAGQKLHALARVSNVMSVNQNKLIIECVHIISIQLLPSNIHEHSELSM